MSAKLKHQHIDQLPVATQERVLERVERTRVKVRQGAGVHRDQLWELGGKFARGGRNGQRAQLQRAFVRGEV